MNSLQLLAFVVICMVTLAVAVPVPEPGWKSPHHEHVVIHVPYHVKHIHHHHVKKVPVYVKSSGWTPVSSGWSNGGGWSGSSGWSSGWW